MSVVGRLVTLNYGLLWGDSNGVTQSVVERVESRDELYLVLEEREHEVLVLSPSGVHGWIGKHFVGDVR